MRGGSAHLPSSPGGITVTSAARIPGRATRPFRAPGPPEAGIAGSGTAGAGRAAARSHRHISPPSGVRTRRLPDRPGRTGSVSPRPAALSGSCRKPPPRSRTETTRVSARAAAGSRARPGPPVQRRLPSSGASRRSASMARGPGGRPSAVTASPAWAGTPERVRF